MTQIAVAVAVAGLLLASCSDNDSSVETGVNSMSGSSAQPASAPTTTTSEGTATSMASNETIVQFSTVTVGLPAGWESIESTAASFASAATEPSDRRATMSAAAMESEAGVAEVYGPYRQAAANSVGEGFLIVKDLPTSRTASAEAEDAVHQFSDQGLEAELEELDLGGQAGWRIERAIPGTELVEVHVITQLGLDVVQIQFLGSPSDVEALIEGITLAWTVWAPGHTKAGVSGAC